jgi:hypothetical protein
VDGKKVWQTKSTKLVDLDLQHRTQQSVEDDAERFLKSLNPVKPAGVLAKSVPTFKEQAEIWLERCESRQGKPIKPATLREWRSYLNVHILPVFQNVLLPDVTNQAPVSSDLRSRSRISLRSSSRSRPAAAKLSLAENPSTREESVYGDASSGEVYFFTYLTIRRAPTSAPKTLP